MDFSRFKPGQLACITTLDAPLVVSAGAGSGKTFTLTQRIAWALMEGSAPEGGAFLDGIEQVMAITFTEKAAGEIKSRVKSTLRAEGMASEALKVDDAWISTIHGMCSRILRTHAVELGIDPSFSVLDPAQADELIRASVADVLAGANEFVAPEGLDALFAEYPARSTGGFSTDSVESMLVESVRIASSSPKGCDVFLAPPRARGASTLARLLLETVEEAREAALLQKASSSRDSWIALADEFVDHAGRVIAQGGMDPRGLLTLCDACPWPSARFGAKEYKAHAADLQASCAEIIQEARCLYAEPLLDDLLRITRLAYEKYRLAKKQRAVLDNDDLLIQAARALAQHEGIAREFADKFKIVMVDEFQDTDQLQVDMIARMAGDGGRRLCTVGDAQQSIYRFRGADVQVYKRHLAKIEGANPEGLIELPDNFRSHADVLHFVDRVFEQDRVFGKEFMSLSASRFESSVKSPFKGSDTRVDVLLTTYPARSGIDAFEVTCFEARRIAQRFSELRDAGHRAGDMVILLGRMTKAAAFADALRDAGFACVIAGGSIFSSAPEVRVMQRLVEVIANPHATASLFELLSSDMFLLSADDFIALSTVFDDAKKIYRRRGIDVGFEELSQRLEDGEAEVSARLAHAVRVVENLAARAGRLPVARIMVQALEESGWLSRLEGLGAEGQSVAGNILKAVRIVEGFEKNGLCGPASVAQAFAEHIETAKEAPGALSAQGGDFVRIMTVHASKGLEFPIVAVAEMGRTNARSSVFPCNSVDGNAFVSLAPQRSLSGLASASPLVKAMDKKYEVGRAWALDGSCDPLEAALSATSPMVRREALRAYEADQELQERRRLLYVALTRAKEALVVSMTSTRPSGDPQSSGIGADAGIYDDIRSALFGEGDIPQGVTSVEFGGSMPAIVRRVDTEPADYEPVGEQGLSKSDVDGEDADGMLSRPSLAACDASAACAEPSDSQERTVGVPLLVREERVCEEPSASARRDIASYSALARADGIEGALSGDGASTRSTQPGEALCEDDAFWGDLCDELLHDADRATDLGTAFHLCAQQAVCLRGAHAGALCRPSDARVAAVARSCDLGAASMRRLDAALDRWFASDIARLCEKADALTAELPFFIELEGGSEAHPIRYLEGSMDLVAFWRSGEGESADRALIVDYKTGGSSDETEEMLRAKHALQASCYAYGALLQGIDEVEAVFVRVEQDDPNGHGGPGEVRYRFSQDDVASLRSRIDQACVRLEGQRSA